jgi:hypothetical protein
MRSVRLDHDYAIVRVEARSDVTTGLWKIVFDRECVPICVGRIGGGLQRPVLRVRRSSP